MEKNKPKLLLHICCAGCGAYISQELARDWQISWYFYNPNIYPVSEYKKREQEVISLASKHKISLIVSDYEHGAWLNKIKGHERDPERGERCVICYEDRLESTARKAKSGHYDYFTTTLTVSPHKDAAVISQLGKRLAERYKVNFLNRDFKKQDGFKKASALSKELGLYRQNYCGCEYG